MHDVALVAGVSAQTVSRVVRNAPGVAPETRERVRRVIADLGYRPNLAARSLSARRIGSVQVVVAASLFHGTTTAFVAICEALAARGLATSTSVARDRHNVSKAIPISADGVIVLGGTRETPMWLDSIAARVPVIYVGRVDQLPANVTGVMIDQVAGAELAVQHLASRGCERIGHIAGPEDWLDARLRLQGFTATAARLGLPCEVVEAGSWEAVDAMQAGLKFSPHVDGMFAANDHLALGFLSRCQDRGVRVPEDIKVVGFDDTAGSDAYPPPLTTVAQDFQRLGDSAVAQLWAALMGEQPQNVVLQPELVHRASA